MPRPAFRFVVNRKDGDDITFTDYLGQKQTKKFAPIGVAFPNKAETGFNLVLDKKVTLDPEVLWIAMYPVEDRDDEDERPRKSSKKQASPKKRDEEEDESDELSF